jgi:hypothetical protein
LDITFSKDINSSTNIQNYEVVDRLSKPKISKESPEEKTSSNKTKDKNRASNKNVFK